MTLENPRAFFDEQFRRFYGNQREPYHWQQELFDRLVRGDVPRLIDLPTGTGKTSVMSIWYLALAWMMRGGGPIVLPRRLIWVVNRRVVVDQATEEAEKLRCFDALPKKLAVSTLRGQLADNGDWKLNPVRPAIVIGTVDMIGSKLLFSGYGDGPYWRAQHAGLLGVDALFVNDEAHLTPAFAKLVRAVENLQPAAKIQAKQFLFCELSATPTAAGKESRFPDTLEADLNAESEFRARCTADKRLHLHREADKKKAEAKFVGLAKEEGVPRTIVFRERPEEARTLADRLEAAHKGRVALLTGTMRGWERDQLRNYPVFQYFLAKEAPEQPVWLVATSAGEVGVDLTAERQITMLMEADHLIQRFGRLNRFGGAQGDAHVVFTQPTDKEPEKAAALQWLESLPALGGQKDIRALTLYQNPAPAEAFTPLPRMAELEDWLVELWSQTTGKASYPKVEYWLHGKQEDIPETGVAWRLEVEELIHGYEAKYITEDDLRDAFKSFPVLPHEKLTEPTSRVKGKFKELAEKRPGVKALVRGRDGTVKIMTLETLSQENTDLDEATIVLPRNIGKLAFGMLSPEIEEEGADLSEKDIADKLSGSSLNRRHSISDTDTGNDNEKVVLSIKLFDESDEEAEKKYLIYCVMRPEKVEGGRKEYLLDTHLKEVAEKAADFARELIGELEPVYRWAGNNHDEGKDRQIWQRAMGRCPGKVVAKSFKAPAPKQMAGYRHELGTLAKLKTDDAPIEHRELALHLIAAHHGHARPYFHDRSHDIERIEDSQSAIDATPQRFARLTQEWGPWGLAYLEAIFRSADGLVSGLADGKYQVEGQIEDDGN